MKKTIFLLCLLLGGLPVSAATGTATANILKYRSYDTTLGLDWVMMDVTSAPGTTCDVFEGHLILYIKDDVRGDRQVSMILSALAQGNEVKANYDDTQKNGDHCYLRYLQAY